MRSELEPTAGLDLGAGVAPPEATGAGPENGPESVGTFLAKLGTGLLGEKRPYQSAPEDTAPRFATIPREKDATELRISDRTFNGHRFLSIQRWRLAKGGWWPVKGQNLTIQFSELGRVKAGLDLGFAAAIETHGPGK